MKINTVEMFPVWLLKDQEWHLWGVFASAEVAKREAGVGVSATRAEASCIDRPIALVPPPLIKPKERW